MDMLMAAGSESWIRWRVTWNQWWSSRVLTSTPSSNTTQY